MYEKIAFIADSCADLPKEILEKENVFVLPVTVTSQGKEYLDGVDITPEDIYEQQRQGNLPVTSLPTGEALEKVLKAVLEKGYNKAVLITMSSAISGTWNMCRLLCEECEQLECYVFDSGMASLAEGALLIELIDEVEAGTLVWDQIPNRLEVLKNNTFPYFGIDTLEFLQKSGRIGKAAAIAGNFLNIMPILTFDENGVITPIEKVRGRKQRVGRLKSHAAQSLGEHKKYRLYFVNGGDEHLLDGLKEKVLEELSAATHVMTGTLGCALAAHLGPNLIGVCVQILEEDE